jgi:hypothetical protein
MPEDPTALASRLDTDDGVTIEDLHAALDEMDDAGRLAFVRILNKGRQDRLWALSHRHMESSLDMLVPEDVGDGRTAVFEGRNSMAVFNQFQKRFTRAADGSGELWGYNHQTWGWFTGPGYFVTVKDDDRGILVFDYTRIPGQAPQGWPALKENKGFPTGIVYGDMLDELRPVTRDVHIGKAFFSSGKERGYYFTLVRAAVL